MNMKKFLQILVWVFALFFRFVFTPLTGTSSVVFGALFLALNLLSWSLGQHWSEMFELLLCCIGAGVAVLLGNLAIEWGRDHTFLAQYPGLDL